MSLVRSALIAAMLGLAGTVASPQAFAADEHNISVGATIAGPGLAVHGYDVVSYFNGSPEIGSDDFAVAYKGAAYRFASKADLDAFNASPDKYVPAYGGFCAYGTALGKKFDGDPRFWKVVDGKLYLNLNRDIQAKWSGDIAGNIKKADATWPTIMSIPASKL